MEKGEIKQNDSSNTGLQSGSSSASSAVPSPSEAKLTNDQEKATVVITIIGDDHTKPSNNNHEKDNGKHV